MFAFKFCFTRFTPLHNVIDNNINTYINSEKNSIDVKEYCFSTNANIVETSKLLLQKKYAHKMVSFLHDLVLIGGIHRVGLYKKLFNDHYKMINITEYIKLLEIINALIKYNQLKVLLYVLERCKF